MPNQRKASKVHLGGYYEKELKDELKKLAKDRGITMSELVDELLREGVKNYRRLRGR